MEKVTEQNHELSVVDLRSLTVSKTKIYVSSDYDKFTLSEFNRIPSLSKKLSESIRKNDLTQYNPILVDNRLVIIDGQHRFLVCMELGLPIYFIISDEVMINDAADINQASKNWSTLDYIIHYYKRGVESYVKLVDYSKKYNLHTTNLLALGKGSVDKNQTITDLTKSGKFRFKMSDEKVEELLNNFQVFREFYDFADTTIFFKAYIRVASLNDYQPERMLAKLNEASGIVHRQPRQQLQIEELLKLYNYGVRKQRLKLDKQTREKPEMIGIEDEESDTVSNTEEEVKELPEIKLDAKEEAKAAEPKIKRQIKLRPRAELTMNEAKNMSKKPENKIVKKLRASNSSKRKELA